MFVDEDGNKVSDPIEVNLWILEHTLSKEEVKNMVPEGYEYNGTDLTIQDSQATAIVQKVKASTPETREIRGEDRHKEAEPEDKTVEKEIKMDKPEEVKPETVISVTDFKVMDELETAEGQISTGQAIVSGLVTVEQEKISEKETVPSNFHKEAVKPSQNKSGNSTRKTAPESSRYESKATTTTMGLSILFTGGICAALALLRKRRIR